MSKNGQTKISGIPAISAIYYALLQCGYDFFSMERGNEHIDVIQKFALSQCAPSFFSETRQMACEVYPYWPRAAILETATFYLLPDYAGYENFDDLRNQVMSAGNIADQERGNELWNWLADFPNALKAVLDSTGFEDYLKWEQQWIAQQNLAHEKELSLIHNCLDRCVKQYHSPVQDIQIVINPIKCIYSADYHMKDNCFVFSSGIFRAESVIHEFLHHVLHTYILLLKERITQKPCKYPGLDSSYYLSGDDAGKCNAFEEYAVREWTKSVMDGRYPSNLMAYLEELL